MKRKQRKKRKKVKQISRIIKYDEQTFSKLCDIYGISEVLFNSPNSK